MIGDYKTSGISSSTSNYGSNEWSDSQLMMMLNPIEYLNSGYTDMDAVPLTSAATYSLTKCIDDNTYICAGSTKIYKNMGAYWNIDTAIKMHKPSTTNSYSPTELTSVANTDIHRIGVDGNKIATVKWHVTGSSQLLTASGYYNKERNINGTGEVYLSGSTRSKIWYGKVGLMYPSDYGYATNGTLSTSENDIVLTRDECLTHYLSIWSINNTSSSFYNCAATDWLLYVDTTGNTTTTKGTATSQWTITPAVSPGILFSVAYDGKVIDSFWVGLASLAIRPTLYLEPNVKITGGNGSYDSPFVLQ